MLHKVMLYYYTCAPPWAKPSRAAVAAKAVCLVIMSYVVPGFGTDPDPLANRLRLPANSMPTAWTTPS